MVEVGVAVWVVVVVVARSVAGQETTAVCCAKDGQDGRGDADAMVIAV